MDTTFYRSALSDTKLWNLNLAPFGYLHFPCILQKHPLCTWPKFDYLGRKNASSVLTSDDCNSRFYVRMPALDLSAGPLVEK